ncbi:aminotransferase class I/II-fold pyridoxal phosphate-dependent enzyme [Streptomyces flaveolus]|uniref:pyridoxal phosphate-dependent aminotransferase n=1 Tax=Streptomyces flaveolus TaxID=67297 RepID=UPI00342CBDAA
MHSATLAINEKLQARRAAGQKVLHLGFGEAGLPVPDSIAAVLSGAVGRNDYGPVVGSLEARDAAAGWFSRRGLPTSPEQVLFAPGSKPLLFALLASLPGDVVLPCPSWVSYAAQASLVGKRTIDVPIPGEAGGVPDPALLEQALRAARETGARPGILVLTVPDNPTGTVARRSHVQQVCAVAERWGLAVIADEIYRELVHDGQAPSATEFLPENTVVTTGLSKSMALGGWRIGLARVPDGQWGRKLLADLTGVASEIWSSLATPMQAVATHVLQDPPYVLAHVERSRQLHAAVAQAVHAEFVAAGAVCRRPEAGFYLYPDFEPVRQVLEARGITGGASLAAALLDRHGVGVLAGEAFGDTETALRARVATSLLYGQSEAERWEALNSTDPVSLPWIAASLGHLREALGDLTGQG